MSWHPSIKRRTPLGACLLKNVLWAVIGAACLAVAEQARAESLDVHVCTGSGCNNAGQAGSNSRGAAPPVSSDWDGIKKAAKGAAHGIKKGSEAAGNAARWVATKIVAGRHRSDQAEQQREMARERDKVVSVQRREREEQAQAVKQKAAKDQQDSERRRQEEMLHAELQKNLLIASRYQAELAAKETALRQQEEAAEALRVAEARRGWSVP